LPGLAANTDANDVTGLQIMRAVEQRHRVESESILQTMQLGSGDDIIETRTLQIYTRQDQQGLDQSLIVFKAPADVRGTALLIKETATDDDDQWLYSPSRRRITRVAQGSKRNYFMGTDFSYEDLEPENLDHHRYRRLEDSDHTRGSCFVIEAVPVDEKRAKRSAYSRRIIYVRQDIYYPVEILFFDHHNRHVKTLVNQELLQITNASWRPQKITMNHHQRNHHTTIKVDRHEVDADIHPMVFSERYLTSERHLN
jgi:hypothetical protein